MNIRKARFHQTGLSNIAPRTELPKLNIQPQTSRINMLAMDKSKRLAGIFSKRLSTDSSPTKTTESYYQSVRRPIHQKPQLQFPRSAQLEEKDKRKPVFTGESDLYFDANLEKYREYGLDCVLTPMPTVYNKQTLIQEKKDINGTAIQETQLVGYDKYSVDTLKGNINLEKVREAKRILRRRYANRNNLQKIYAAWDEDNKGFVSLENMYSMSNKLGLNLNLDEARVLLASANRSGTGELDLDEFLDLIYNKDDALNVDLNKLSEQVDDNYLMKIEEIYKGDNNLIKKLENDAQRTRNNRHWNQVRLVLKNKLGQIVSGLLAADTESLGYLSPEKFKEIIKRLSISDTIVSEQDIKSLFDKFKHKDSLTINYKAFVDELKGFTFDYEFMYNEMSNSPVRFSDTNRRGITLPEEIKGGVNILDCRTLPYQQMIEYWGRSRRVSDDIKRYFPTKNDLQDYFSKCLKINKENVDESYVSQKQLQKIVSHIFKNFDHSGLKKEDFEGFLSSCLYNKQGYTNLQQVCKTVYEETEKEYIDKITYKKKGLPPHFAVNKQEQEDLLKISLKSVEPTDAQPEQSSQIDKELKTILDKVDNRVFVGTQKQFDIYNTFDVDKDGYVSTQDFMKKLEDLAILNSQEISRLLDYVDTEKKGYLCFTDFSQKIRPNMTHDDEKGEPKIFSYATPHKQHVKDLLFNNDKFKKTIHDITKALSPPKTVEQQTRFGASPVWSNTFQNLQPVGDSSMAITEAQRFNRSHLHRTLFQKEESDKKKIVTLGRLEAIRTHRDIMEKTIEENTSRQESKIANGLKKKAIEQILYEKRAKLKNDFAH